MSCMCVAARGQTQALVLTLHLIETGSFAVCSMDMLILLALMLLGISATYLSVGVELQMCINTPSFTRLLGI